MKVRTMLKKLGRTDITYTESFEYKGREFELLINEGDFPVLQECTSKWSREGLDYFDILEEFDSDIESLYLYEEELFIKLLEKVLDK